MSPGQRIEASTKVTSGKCTLTWTIKNYRLIKFKVGRALKSPKFGVGNDDKQYFQLWLYPEGVDKESAGYISLSLQPIIDPKNKPDKLVCRWTVSVINDKKVVRKLTLHCNFVSDKQGFGYGCSKFFRIEDIDHLISAKNSLTLHQEIEILEEFQSVLNSDIICNKDETVYTIKFDFSFLSEKLSDVKLIVEEDEVPAHKIVLAAVSPVFRDMLENNENSVKITDITEDILTEMLRYIYTGEIDAIETDQIIELLAAADKYQIDNLKIKCGKMLSGNLDTENAIDILLAAHKCKIKNLEDEVIKFVTTHIQLFSYSEEMKKIDDPDLWITLTQSIIKSQRIILKQL